MSLCLPPGTNSIFLSHLWPVRGNRCRRCGMLLAKINEAEKETR